MKVMQANSPKGDGSLQYIHTEDTQCYHQYKNADVRECAQNSFKCYKVILLQMIPLFCACMYKIIHNFDHNWVTSRFCHFLQTYLGVWFVWGSHKSVHTLRTFLTRHIDRTYTLCTALCVHTVR